MKARHVLVVALVVLVLVGVVNGVLNGRTIGPTLDECRRGDAVSLLDRARILDAAHPATLDEAYDTLRGEC